MFDLSRPEFYFVDWKEKSIILLMLSIMRYNIWLERNRVIFENKIPHCLDIINRIKVSINSRINVEKFKNNIVWVNILQKLKNCLL